MKKMLSLLVCGMLVVGMVGCESAEDREIRVTEAVKSKFESLMGDDDLYTQMTNKEWSYSKLDSGEEVVTLTGTITYIFSVNVSYNFYINDGYITKMSYNCMDKTESVDLPKNEKSKLDM